MENDRREFLQTVAVMGAAAAGASAIARAAETEGGYEVLVDPDRLGSGTKNC